MTVFENPLRRGSVVLVSAAGAAEGSGPAAAALACAGSDLERAALLVDAGGAPPRPTLVASAASQRMEERLTSHLPEHRFAARGQICRLSVPASAAGLELAAAAAAAARDSHVVLHLPPGLLQEASRLGPLGATGILLRADLRADRALVGLAVRSLADAGLRVAVLKRRLSWVCERRALFGALAAPAGLPDRLLARLLPEGRAGVGERRAESGQALVLALGAVFALLATALALVAIAGAVTGKGRVQRAADLVAISTARSMRDDLPRLAAPARLSGGRVNPAHISKREYLARARAAAARAAGANGVDPRRVAVLFPDASASLPLRAKVVMRATLAIPPEGGTVEASAEAEAAAPFGGGAVGTASGGGYGGPLAYRDGKGMRPDVAAAYDRMAAAARADGVALVVVSGFRSDAEQAALFAAHPDPRWVAPPGRSLHRCATELDLGPSSAYGWLAANAARFGFVQRYAWEAWHYGFTAGPPPCSPAGESTAAAGGTAAGGSLPPFVPARFREPILRSARRWGVPPALMAGQLMAESGFDPDAGSPAGAEGIAQFMPGTAASYGLADPFEPIAAIDAEAHLMSDLLRRFGSPELALAAYNAGPGAVEACRCVPPYPETRAYVSRILALIGGAGAVGAPSFEVRLIA